MDGISVTDFLTLGSKKKIHDLLFCYNTIKFAQRHFQDTKYVLIFTTVTTRIIFLKGDPNPKPLLRGILGVVARYDRLRRCWSKELITFASKLGNSRQVKSCKAICQSSSQAPEWRV